MKNLTEEQAFNRAASLCSASECCKADISDKLRRWQMSATEVERIVTRLESERFIDESRYAKAFVRDKYRFNKWGIVKISQLLRMKHISDADIDCALEEIDRQEYLNILRDLLRSKQKDVRAASDYEKTMKLVHFAMGRGFEADDIRQILKGTYEDDMPDD